VRIQTGLDHERDSDETTPTSVCCQAIQGWDGALRAIGGQYFRTAEAGHLPAEGWEGPRDRRPNVPLGGHEGGCGVPTPALHMYKDVAAALRPDR